MPPRQPSLPLPQDLARALAEQEQRVTDATGRPELAAMATRLMVDTWTWTLAPRELPDGSTGIFVVTGDIPAMWLRDSSAQMRPFLPLAGVPEVAEVLVGVARMQACLIVHDPWANAFTDPRRRHLPLGGSHHLLDNHVWRPSPLRHRRADPWVWERKYEVDSLAFPVQLARALWRSGVTGHLDEQLHIALGAVVDTWQAEQHHEHSPYRFTRLGSRDSLPRGGRGDLVATTGMTWQGFRPSDDRCTLGYNIPAQLMAARSLRELAELARGAFDDEALAGRAERLRSELLDGVERFGLLGDGSWAYEVDGLGGFLAADDANMPSLLSLPLLADVGPDDPRYLATRERILSGRNPWWHAGSAACGIGSPHTPGARVWPISLAVKGLTSTDADERLRMALLLADTTGGTGMVHESFAVDDPTDFSRAWFSWANMMFCELVQSLAPRTPADAR